MASLMVDTDVLIDYLRDQPQAATFLESLEEPPCVSVVSVAELFAGVRDGAEREALGSSTNSMMVERACCPK
jgi:predicted nucleic acid-binding protein